MKNTKIQWTDHTWPIVNGCRRVSRGCEGCYAERLEATRLAHTPKYSGLATMTSSGPRWTGESRLWEPDLDWPFRLKKPAKIFVADMGDLFYENVKDEDIDRVWAVMATAYWHTFQVLTKRPERMRDYVKNAKERVREAILHDVLYPSNWSKARKEDAWQLAVDRSWPLDNIWLGTSVEDQETADERIPILLDTPAAVRWVSYEPALAEVSFVPWLYQQPCDIHGGDLGDGYSPSCPACRPPLSWLVCGGESGPRARPCDIAWLRSVVDQCREAGTAAFVKQLGSFSIWGDGVSPVLRDKKGGDISEFPEDLRVREFPNGASLH